jgi:glutathione synthase/RimK-type ligase-like ATP-grasp enzyme
MLWGLSGDPPFDSVRRELVSRAVPHVVFDQRDAWRVRFDLKPDGMAGRLVLDGQAVDVDDVSAIFVRPYDILQVIDLSAETSAANEIQCRAVALSQQLFAWADIADARVVNRPSAMASNCSKPYQAELIRRSGFAIPPTVVTTSPSSARAFIGCHEQVIYKSVSGNRSTVSRVGTAELHALDDVVNCPTQFQAYIPGTDWRVHVVGDDVYACEIDCAGDDYRVAELDGIPLAIRPAALPASIAARCHALAHSLNLPLAGIDLRRTADDAWYCFEVNPSPGFTYYEQATGQPLSTAVARLLSDACPDSARGHLPPTYSVSYESRDSISLHGANSA